MRLDGRINGRGCEGDMGDKAERKGEDRFNDGKKVSDKWETSGDEVVVRHVERVRRGKGDGVRREEVWGSESADICGDVWFRGRQDELFYDCTLPSVVNYIEVRCISRV